MNYLVAHLSQRPIMTVAVGTSLEWVQKGKKLAANQYRIIYLTISSLVKNHTGLSSRNNHQQVSYNISLNIVFDKLSTITITSLEGANRVRSLLWSSLRVQSDVVSLFCIWKTDDRANIFETSLKIWNNCETYTRSFANIWFRPLMNPIISRSSYYQAAAHDVLTKKRV